MSNVKLKRFVENCTRTIVAVGMSTCDTFFEMESLPMEEAKYCARTLESFCGGIHGLMSGWHYERCLNFTATIVSFQCTVLWAEFSWNDPRASNNKYGKDK